MKVFMFIAFTAGIFSCKKDRLPTDSNEILGRWNLVAITYPFTADGEKTIDLREGNARYDFQETNILLVSGYDGSGLEDGVYAYEFKREYLDDIPGSGAEKMELVIIENTKWVFTCRAGRMRLSTAYFDGPVLTFEKPAM